MGNYIVGMKVSIIRVGNSRGIRIPKPVLQQCGLQDEVELDVRDQELVIRATRQVRAGWDEAFRLMAKRGDDGLLDRDARSTGWDHEEWEW